jgi:CRP-like cAMP-binding protein
MSRVPPPAHRRSPSRPTFQTWFERSAGGPLPDWEAVARTITLRAVEPGAAVFHQDVDHPFIYAVRDGLLKFACHDVDGTEWIKAFADEGRCFASLTALPPGGRTTFSATAIEPTTVERLDWRLLAGLAQRHLAWSRVLFEFTLALGTRKEVRERQRLTLSAEDRYLAFCQAWPEIARRVPRQDVARHLGLTPMGLQRIVSRVRRREGAASL